MAESKLRDLSMDFAVEMLKLCESIKRHFSINNQLERSATSIGANIYEANYAQRKPLKHYQNTSCTFKQKNRESFYVPFPLP